MTQESKPGWGSHCSEPGCGAAAPPPLPVGFPLDHHPPSPAGHFSPQQGLESPETPAACHQVCWWRGHHISPSATRRQCRCGCEMSSWSTLWLQNFWGKKNEIKQYIKYVCVCVFTRAFLLLWWRSARKSRVRMMSACRVLSWLIPLLCPGGFHPYF